MVWPMNTHHRRTAAALVAVLALGASGCDAVSEVADDARQAVEDGVDAARETADLVQFCTQAIRVAQAIDDRDVDAAVEAGERMVELAPEEIAAETQVLLDAAKQAQDGNNQALQTEEVQQAAADVRDWTTEHCDPR